MLKGLAITIFAGVALAMVGAAISGNTRQYTDTRTQTELDMAAGKKMPQAKADDGMGRAIVGAAALRSAMRNPSSFVLEEVLIMGNGAACYTYRAQNGFGGTNEELAVLPAKAKHITTAAAAWNKDCAGTTDYHDVTRSVNAMLGAVR